MATIRFFLKATPGKQLHIMASFQHGDEVKTASTNYTLSNKSFWQKKKQRVSGCANANEINKRLNDWQHAFEQYISECKLKYEHPNMTYFKAVLSGKFNMVKEKGETLLSAIDLFLDAIKTTHKPITQRAFKCLRADIVDFEKQYGPIMLGEINTSFYRQFCVFLIAENENINSTINKKQTNLVTVVNFAKKEWQLKIGEQYKFKYRLKQAQAAKFPLQPEELVTLHFYTASTPYQQMVLDAFILATETGLRFSDIQQLKPVHICSELLGDTIVRYIDLVNIKGSKANNVPLSIKACEIVEKYVNYIYEDNHPVASKNAEQLFRFDYSQSTTRVLKHLFEDMKLNRQCELVTIQGSETIREVLPLYDVISFHMARNTYITRLLSANLPAAFVQANAGHSKIEITMGYYRDQDRTRWLATIAALNK